MGITTSRFSDVQDSALDYLVQQFQQRHPNYGEVLLRGYLLSVDIVVPRRRIRESITRLDPLRQRLRWHQANTRRRYKVP